jgi:hypothetical protein
MMFDRAYVVMDRLPGHTLNELTYRRPEVIEEHKVTIAYQLGMHTAFSYVFGAKDGYQTNYIFDPVSKILTRIDKESFLEMPSNADTFADKDTYTQEIAACELTNLKYIPSFRNNESRHKLLYAFKQGFMDKYSDIMYKRDDLLTMVRETRMAWLRMKPVEDPEEYEEETKSIIEMAYALIGQNPEDVYNRLIKAKKEVDSGEYKKTKR